MNEKRRIVYVILLLLVLALAVFYFRPLKFPDVAVYSTVFVTSDDITISGSIPNIEHKDYGNLDSEHKEKLRELFSRYTYRRNLGTWFSEGGLNNSGDKIFYIFLHKDNNAMGDYICISNRAIVSVGNKTCTFSKYEKFLEELEEILSDIEVEE